MVTETSDRLALFPFEGSAAVPDRAVAPSLADLPRIVGTRERCHVHRDRSHAVHMCRRCAASSSSTWFNTSRAHRCESYLIAV
jgi:hypothetical protein